MALTSTPNQSPKDKAYYYIQNGLKNERKMRERFLSGTRRENGIRECDEMLKALDLLHTPTPAQPKPETMKLFGD